MKFIIELKKTEEFKKIEQKQSGHLNAELLEAAYAVALDQWTKLFRRTVDQNTHPGIFVVTIEATNDDA